MISLAILDCSNCNDHLHSEPCYIGLSQLQRLSFDAWSTSYGVKSCPSAEKNNPQDSVGQTPRKAFSFPTEKDGIKHVGTCDEDRLEERRGLEITFNTRKKFGRAQ